MDRAAILSAVKPRRLLLAIAVLAVPLGAFHVAFKRQPDEQAVRHLRSTFTRSTEWRGKLAPDFELALLDGSRFKLIDHIGREVIVLNFFATWCQPCKEEMPELGRFLAMQHGRPVVLIGIDPEEKRELVEAFVSEQKVTFPVGIDASGDVQKRYGVSSYPTTILIGGDGRIQLYQSGAIMNADVAFGPFLGSDLEGLAKGKGTTKELYLEGLKAERYPTPEEEARERDEPKLSDRAQRIAEGMPCPCGCSDTLAKCDCATAKKAKAKLESMALDGRKDADVMSELNREFCMKGME